MVADSFNLGLGVEIQLGRLRKKKPSVEDLEFADHSRQDVLSVADGELIQGLIFLHRKHIDKLILGLVKARLIRGHLILVEFGSP